MSYPLGARSYFHPDGTFFVLMRDITTGRKHEGRFDAGEWLNN